MNDMVLIEDSVKVCASHDNIICAMTVHFLEWICIIEPEIECPEFRKERAPIEPPQPLNRNMDTFCRPYGIGKNTQDPVIEKYTVYLADERKYNIWRLAVSVKVEKKDKVFMEGAYNRALQKIKEIAERLAAENRAKNKEENQ